jgi:hypothetical protein
MIDKFKESKDFNILKCRGWGSKPKAFVHSQLTFWNDEREKWAHSWIKEDLNGNQRDFFGDDNKRTNGFYMILKCLDAINYDRGSDVDANLKIVCDPFIDKFYPVQPCWPSESKNPPFRGFEFPAQFGVTEDNPRYNWVFQNLEVIYDGKPNFYIEFTNLADLNRIDESATGVAKLLSPYEVSEELESWFMKIPPHNCARTLGELFKLIIDWDLAYHEFGNREEIAILCHKILGSINLPVELYELIIKETPDSVVRRYLKNDKNALEAGDRPVTPQKLIDWCREKYWDLRHTSIDEIHNTPPVDDSHYRRRSLV